MLVRLLLIAVLGLACPSIETIAMGQAPSSNDTIRMYVGTTTGRSGAKGIYRVDLDRAAGKLGEITLAGEAVSPGFIAIHPNGKFIYAVGPPRSTDRTIPGVVTSFAIDTATGNVTKLNEESAGTPGPAYVTVDRAGRNVLIANYTGGSAAVLPIADDGKLRPISSLVRHQGASLADPKRQDAPHPHSIYLDAANKFAFVPDLGMDKVMIYRFDPAAGQLVANDPAFGQVPPGSGPRHFAFHPDGRHAYVINELASTVTVFDYDPDRGALSAKQTLSTLPPGVDAAAVGNTTAEVVVHPSGKFLYGSNRGHNSIAVFAIDSNSGTLTPSSHQGEGIKVPRNFNLDPTGRYAVVANLDGDNLALFRIEQATGALQPTGSTVAVPKPMCVKFYAPSM
ncbi:MAG TPA: lactonase family protein [Pirellulales bacterium]|nr:lactonase family protein [Pirellulales bacterium]